MGDRPIHRAGGETIPAGAEEVFVGGVRFIVTSEDEKQRIVKSVAEEQSRKSQSSAL